MSRYCHDPYSWQPLASPHLSAADDDLSAASTRRGSSIQRGHQWPSSDVTAASTTASPPDEVLSNGDRESTMDAAAPGLSVAATPTADGADEERVPSGMTRPTGQLSAAQLRFLMMCAKAVTSRGRSGAAPCALVDGMHPLSEAQIAQQARQRDAAEAAMATANVRFATVDFRLGSTICVAPFRVRPGDVVVVERDGGSQHIGTVRAVAKEQPADCNGQRRVLRLATKYDLASAATSAAEEKRTLATCRALLRRHDSCATVTAVEWPMDLSSLTVAVAFSDPSHIAQWHQDLVDTYQCGVWLLARPASAAPVDDSGCFSRSAASSVGCEAVGEGSQADTNATNADEESEDSDSLTTATPSSAKGPASWTLRDETTTSSGARSIGSVSGSFGGGYDVNFSIGVI